VLKTAKECFSNPALVFMNINQVQIRQMSPFYKKKTTVANYSVQLLCTSVKEAASSI